MKTISFWLSIVALIVTAVPRASAQDAATQQQLDQLSGQIQNVQDMLNQQDKRISDLEKKVSDMQDKLNQPGGSDYASADDLKKLAQQVQEIDQKRQDDNEKILKALEKLGHGGEVEPIHNRTPEVSTPTPPNPGENPTPNATGPQNGYYYTIAPGNTLSAVAKAYRAQGVKVTVAQIIAANPGLNPNSLIVGRKIFIPAPQ